MKRKYLGLGMVVIIALTLTACNFGSTPAPPENTPASTEIPVMESDEGEHQDNDTDAEEMESTEEAAEAETDPTETSPEPAPINPEDLWAANGCANCHGENRQGSAAPPLLPTTLTKEAAIYIKTITEGRGRMPIFGEKMSQEEISALVEWLMTTTPE